MQRFGDVCLLPYHDLLLLGLCFQLALEGLDCLANENGLLPLSRGGCNLPGSFVSGILPDRITIHRAYFRQIG